MLAPIPKKFATALAATLIAMTGTALVTASDSITAYINTPVSITGPDGLCKKITNNHASGLSEYIPTTSVAEWKSFVASPPPGVALAMCCAGTMMNGNCYYKGAGGQSCNAVCASHGGCNLAGTASGGTDQSLCQALGATLSPGVPYYGLLIFGTGCFDAYPNIQGRKIGLWSGNSYMPLTPDASCTVTPPSSTMLFCACNN